MKIVVGSASDELSTIDRVQSPAPRERNCLLVKLICEMRMVALNARGTLSCLTLTTMILSIPRDLVSKLPMDKD